MRQRIKQQVAWRAKGNKCGRTSDRQSKRKRENQVECINAASACSYEYAGECVCVCARARVRKSARTLEIYNMQKGN